jgi:hypothetical protein
MEVFHDVDAARGTQINNAIIKLDGIRAQQTVDGALQKLWDNPRRQRRTSATSMARRLDQLEAIWRAHIDKHPDCMNGPASLSPSPTPSWRVKVPASSSYQPEHTSHNRRRIRRQDRRVLSWERDDSSQTRESKPNRIHKHRWQRPVHADEHIHEMVTRSRTSRRTRFYKLRVPP